MSSEMKLFVIDTFCSDESAASFAVPSFSSASYNVT